MSPMPATLLKGFEPAEVLRIPQVSFSPRVRRFQGVGSPATLRNRAAAFSLTGASHPLFPTYRRRAFTRPTPRHGGA